MKNEDPNTYITSSEEKAAHIDDLALKRTRGDLTISGNGQGTIRVIFLGHGGNGEGSYLLLERLIAIGPQNRIDIGERISVEYLKDGLCFSFESRSIDIEDREGSIRLAFPGKIKKNQKRRFPRTNPMPSPVHEVVVDTGVFAERCSVLDVSAGGLSFITNFEEKWMKPGLPVSLAFTLPESVLVSTSGVLRSHILEEFHLERGKYRCGVEFTDIPGSVRDKIVALIANLQVNSHVEKA